MDNSQGIVERHRICRQKFQKKYCTRLSLSLFLFSFSLSFPLSFSGFFFFSLSVLPDGDARATMRAHTVECPWEAVDDASESLIACRAVDERGLGSSLQEILHDRDVVCDHLRFEGAVPREEPSKEAGHEHPSHHLCKDSVGGSERKEAFGAPDVKHSLRASEEPALGTADGEG